MTVDSCIAEEQIAEEQLAEEQIAEEKLALCDLPRSHRAGALA
jgi:hypothetical protein